ncbi:hypothetical protein Ga0609869_002778 [Rhodovulum iodosum]|uniref:Glyceraldehyde-3-phosphate dehydrogenase n=1 Tax=Rhodovulum iodosum TaxID=68291 RepID=A0ABV3XVP4_9RHOB|nr:hypothetical protein [Rhodovulum robiginosum]
MTNRIAAILLLIIAAALGLDILLQDGAGTLFLARKLFGLIEYLAFWR